MFREEAARANEAMVGQCQLVLVEGVSVPGTESSSPPLRLYTAVITSALPSHFPHIILGLQTVSSPLSFTEPVFSRALS